MLSNSARFSLRSLFLVVTTLLATLLCAPGCKPTTADLRGVWESDASDGAHRALKIDENDENDENDDGESHTYALYLYAPDTPPREVQSGTLSLQEIDGGDFVVFEVTSDVDAANVGQSFASSFGGFDGMQMVVNDRTFFKIDALPAGSSSSSLGSHLWVTRTSFDSGSVVADGLGGAYVAEGIGVDAPVLGSLNQLVHYDASGEAIEMRLGLLFGPVALAQGFLIGEAADINSSTLEKTYTSLLPNGGTRWSRSLPGDRPVFAPLFLTSSLTSAIPSEGANAGASMLVLLDTVGAFTPEFGGDPGDGSGAKNWALVALDDRNGSVVRAQPLGNASQMRLSALDDGRAFVSVASGLARQDPNQNGEDIYGDRGRQVDPATGHSRLDFFAADGVLIGSRWFPFFVSVINAQLFNDDTALLSLLMPLDVDIGSGPISEDVSSETREVLVDLVTLSFRDASAAEVAKAPSTQFSNGSRVGVVRASSIFVDGVERESTGAQDSTWMLLSNACHDVVNAVEFVPEANAGLAMRNVVEGAFGSILISGNATNTVKFPSEDVFFRGTTNGFVAKFSPPPVVAGCTPAQLPPPVSYSLEVEVEGDGVVNFGPNRSCRDRCSFKFDAFAEVEVSYTPDAGAIFYGFSGACTAAPCAAHVDTPLTSLAVRFGPPATDVVLPLSDDLTSLHMAGETLVVFDDNASNQTLSIGGNTLSTPGIGFVGTDGDAVTFAQSSTASSTFFVAGTATGALWAEEVAGAALVHDVTAGDPPTSTTLEVSNMSNVRSIARAPGGSTFLLSSLIGRETVLTVDATGAELSRREYILDEGIGHGRLISDVSLSGTGPTDVAAYFVCFFDRGVTVDGTRHSGASSGDIAVFHLNAQGDIVDVNRPTDKATSLFYVREGAIYGASRSDVTRLEGATVASTVTLAGPVFFDATTAPTSEGFVRVATATAAEGFEEFDSFGGLDIFISWHDVTGALLRTATVGSPGDETALQVAAQADGTLWLSGFSSAAGEVSGVEVERAWLARVPR